MENKGEKLKWIAVGAGAVLLVLAVFAAGMHFGGKKNGEAKEAVKPAIEEKADAAEGKDSVQPTETPAAPSRQEPAAGEGVSRGHYVAAADDAILFYLDERLGSASINSDGTVADVTLEETMKGRFYGLARQDSVLYFTSTEGIYKLDPKEKGQPEQLSSETSNKPFSVYDGYLYIMKEDTLYRIPVSGGEIQTLFSGAADFIVTNQGIYYIGKGGKLFHSDYEGKAVEQVAEAEAESRLFLYGNDIYIKNEEVWQYNIPEKKIAQIPLKQKCSSDKDLWVTDQFLLYESAEGEACQYFIETGEEKIIGNVYIPSQETGQIYGDFIYYSFNSGDLSWLSLKDFSDEDIDVEGPLYAAKGTPPADSEAEKDSGYQIAANLSLDTGDNLARVNTDHFTLTLDYDDYAKGLWGWDVTSSDSMVFYDQEARDAGFGGVVFWLEAYDWGSNDYDQLPAYKIAGLTNDKKYVVSFATDVQYDSNSQEQTENYQRLREFAQRIDQDREDNPLTVR